MLGEAHRRLERGTDRGRRGRRDARPQEDRRPDRGHRDDAARSSSTTAASGSPNSTSRRCCSAQPQVVLVDELAHTNTPGSKNPKRWQDVEELLDAGITVISTVNVQHLESLNDVVTQITGIEQQEKVPDEIVRAADQIELVDITPEALRRRLAHGNVYAPERIDAALSNYFRKGNLTALRELALLWLADQVDAALEKYREENQITATWEARERVVVAVTGGPESETLVRRASRIASKSSAELMVVHVVRGDGLSGVSAPQMGKVRELAASLGATLHTVVGDDVPSALLDFARDENATQLVIGTSRRSRWARIFDEGIGATVVQQSGSIDVHMVTHPEARKGSLWSQASPRQQHLASWLAAVVVPSAICALVVCVLDPFLDVGGESALFFVGVLVVALLGGVAPAALSAVLSGLLLNYFLIEPRHTFTIAEPDNAVTTVVLLAVAVAVAVLVDSAAKRTREARQASQEAELLALFAGSVLRGADLDTLLERVRETYSQRAVSMLRITDGNPTARSSLASAKARAWTSIPPTPQSKSARDHDEFWMLMAGRKLPARDRTGAHRRRQTGGRVGANSASLPRRPARPKPSRRPTNCGARCCRPSATTCALPWRPPRPRCRACAATTSTSPPRTPPNCWPPSRSRSTSSPRLVGNLLDSSRLAAGVLRPELRRVYLEETVQRALLGISKGITGFRRRGLDRVKVEVGDAVVIADGGLLERVLANLVDNALRYAPDSPVRVTAGQVGDRVLIAVVDEGPGIPRGTEDQLFAPFQRLGDQDTSTGVGLGLSVAHGFVEAMGGTISATDTPGGGLTVEIDLAAAPKEESA